MPQISADVGGIATHALSNTVLFDDFEDTPVKWAQLLPTAARVTNRAYNGIGSLHLTPAGPVAGFWNAAAARGFPAVRGRVSLECYWASPIFTIVSFVEFGIANAKQSLVAPIRYFPSSFYWALPDTENIDRVLLPSHANTQYLPLTTVGGGWHTLRAVVDFDSGKFETLEADDMALDIGDYTLPNFAYLSQTIGVDAGAGQIGDVVYFALAGDVGSDLYFDDVRVASE